ncbi:hypothetical protein [uncultured Xanthomonas sp.]|uniref:hypothetical protein n=1 Tax=uncultured Xanthomonas sp. TaxID=152831 RepID=UPI0025D2662A|nr:hypothetical protein [uncultured Xanthomonas sp.]
MASSDWNSLDRYVPPSQRHYCAFLDILGYKEKSRKFFAGQYNLSERINRAYENAFGTMNMTSHLYDTSGIKVRFFSDSIVITADVKEKSEDELFGVVQFCSLLATFLSYEDLFVRGGISSGAYSERNVAQHSFISSVGLEKAYYLESTVAKNPRIMFDKDLYDELSAEGKKYIFMEKGEMVLNFARSFIFTNPEHSNIYKEMVDVFKSRGAESDAGVREKYTWVLDYYYWSVKSIQGIDLGRFKQFWSGQDRGFSLID